MLYPGRYGNNMTYSVGKAVFPGAGTFCRVAAVVLLAGLAGCSTSNVENTAYSQDDATGPKDTRTFPNMNIPPQNAAPQFTDAQRKAKLEQLKAAQSAAQARPGDSRAAADNATLNALAADHGRDTLRQIEGGGTCDPALDPTCK